MTLRAFISHYSLVALVTQGYLFVRRVSNKKENYYFNPASLFFASSTSGRPGSASFQRERNYL